MPQINNFIDKFHNSPVLLWSFYISNNHGGFFPFDSFQSAYDFSQKNPRQCLCENTTFYSRVKPFFDLEWNFDLDPQLDVNLLIDLLKNKLIDILGPVNILLFVKSAHGQYQPRNSDSSYYRMSYHLILNIFHNDLQLCFRNKDEIKKFYLNVLNIHPNFDMDAYKGANLRLLNQDKYDKGTRKFHKRILVKDPLLSTSDNDLDSFLGYFSSNHTIYIDEFIQKRFVLNIVKELGYSKDYSFDSFQDIQYDPNHFIFSLELSEQKCPKRSHHSNNSKAMLFIPQLYIDHINSLKSSKNAKLRSEVDKSFPSTFTIKCMDFDCQASTTFHINLSQFSISSNKQTSKNCDDTSVPVVGYPVDNQHLQDTIYKTGQDIFIKSGSIAKQCQYIGPNRFSMDCLLSPMFQNSNKHNFYSDNDTCKNNFNDYSFPIDIGVLNALKMLKQEYTMDQLKSLNIHIGDVNNYITNNNNNTTNHFHNKEDDVQIKSKSDISNIQFGSDDEQTYVYKLFRGRMNYITSLYDVLVPNDFIYIPCDKKDKTIFYFTNFFNNKKTKGGLWTNTDGIKQLKKRIRNTLENYFDKLISQDNLDKKILKKLELVFKNVLSIIDQQGKIEQYAMETYQDSSIVFNQNKHLIHFINGTYDLDNQEFIQTTPDMYNTQMISYEYNKNQSYDFIEHVLQQIIGQDEYPWFIKQLSNCLHPDRVIEQKQIVILTGQGNNGKTLVFNLMNNTMDTAAYGVNGRSILLQASNEQMSAATPDLMLLKDKRFCNFPELDSKKPFNQQQVKQLTGGDMVQGRNLYDQLQEFKPQAGLFISCNKIPNIDTTDGGFLNRIKILELKNQFVDNPDHQFHIKKDKKLLGKIETKKWRSAFFNLLLYFYNQDDITVPNSILSSIQSKVDLNLDPIEIWGEQNLQFIEGSYLIPEKAKDEYNDKTNSHVSSTKYFQKELQQYFSKFPQKYSNVQYKLKRLNQDDIQQYHDRAYVFVNVSIKS